MDNAQFLREQARKCRRLANMVSTPDVSKTLIGMADDYDARAAKLEAEGETPPSGSGPGSAPPEAAP
jgi:hypothetical protein